MATKVRIPTTLRPLTSGESTVSADGSTVKEVIERLDASFPGMAAQLLDSDGSLRRFVNVFLSDEDVRFMDGLQTPVPDGSTIAIVPAVAGGN